MARLITARENASALVLVAVVGREPREVADVVVKDVEAWVPFSQSSSRNAEEAERPRNDRSSQTRTMGTTATLFVARRPRPTNSCITPGQPPKGAKMRTDARNMSRRGRSDR